MTSFFPHRVSQCPIIVNNRYYCLTFYYQRFTDIVLKLGRAYQWENCIKTTNCARMQTLWQVSQSHCLVYAERLSQCGRLDRRLS